MWWMDALSEEGRMSDCLLESRAVHDNRGTVRYMSAATARRPRMNQLYMIVATVEALSCQGVRLSSRR